LALLGHCRHDNSGHSPDWHLQQVEVTSSTRTTYLFPCGDWLRADGGQLDGCRRELLVGQPGKHGELTVHCVCVGFLPPHHSTSNQ
jgi:hypothetical protein